MPLTEATLKDCVITLLSVLGEIRKPSMSCSLLPVNEDVNVIKYSLNEARDISGKDKIIGISTHSLAQFTAANDNGVDYIAFGPVFKTKTKDYFLGALDVKEVVRIAKKPVFFIGGINLTNIGSILKEGAKNIALIRGITDAKDIKSRTMQFKEALKQ